MDRELEIESLKTPKGGTVPTVKGLQTIIDNIYKDLSPLEQSLAGLTQGSQSVANNVENLSNRLESIQQFLADFLLMLGKIDAALSQLNQRVMNLENNQEGSGITKLDLFEIRGSLADLLAQSKFSDIFEDVQQSVRSESNVKERDDV